MLGAIGYMTGVALYIALLAKWPKVGLAITAIVMTGAAVFGGLLRTGAVTLD